MSQADFNVYDPMDEYDDIRDEQALAESIYPVKCVCGFIGMSDDCRRNECPNCGLRVTKDY